MVRCASPVRSPVRSVPERARAAAVLFPLAAAAALLAACERGGENAAPAAASQAPATALPAPGETSAPNETPGTAQQAADTPAVDADTAAASERYEQLYTVQVAALVEPDSARALADEMRGRELPVFTSETREGGRVVHRVRVGATPSLAEARILGRWLTREFDWPVWVAALEDPGQVSSAAVEATRRFLRNP